MRGCIVASFSQTGVLLWPHGVYKPGVPWAPSIVFVWLASAVVWHGLSCRFGAYAGLLEISGMKVWGCICFCWPVFCGSWAILFAGVGSVVVHLFSPCNHLN